MATTADIRNGLVIEFNNDLYSVVEFQHVKPGKGPAFIRTKLKNLKHGRVIANTFDSGAKIDIARVERRKYQYLYKDDSGFHFMNTENYEQIYRSDKQNDAYRTNIEPMFREVYNKLLAYAKSQDENSVLYKHHICFIENERKYYSGSAYREEEPNQIVVDYIASMTDDYFVDLYKFLFPSGKYRVNYISYFEDL